MTDEPLPPHSRDFDAVAELINSKADIRLAAMIGVGYLEKYLQTFIVGALSRAFPDFDQGAMERKILKGPLRNVSARIDFAEALGLIQPKVAADLRVFLDIRNRFAHHISAKDCRDGEVAKLIGRLSIMQEIAADRVAAGEEMPSPDDLLRVMIGASVSGLHELIENPTT